MARKKRKAVIEVGSSDDSDKENYEALSESDSEDYEDGLHDSDVRFLFMSSCFYNFIQF